MMDRLNANLLLALEELKPMSAFGQVHFSWTSFARYKGYALSNLDQQHF